MLGRNSRRGGEGGFRAPLVRIDHKMLSLEDNRAISTAADVELAVSRAVERDEYRRESN